MKNSIEQIAIIFEELKDAYYLERVKNEELNSEVIMLRQAKQLFLIQIESLQQEISQMVESDLSKLSLNKDYEELQAKYKQAQFELQNQQTNSYEKELLYKRQIYMLESESQDQRILIEKQKQTIAQMDKDVEDMFKKLTKTGYGELVACNQTLINRIHSQEDKLGEQKMMIEKIKSTSNEELSRLAFNYEILVQQYQTLLKENSNLIKNQASSKNPYQMTAQKLSFDIESMSPKSNQATTAKKKKY